MRNYKAEDVNAYIACADAKARPKLEELRNLVKFTIPNVEEGISWGVPFYKYHGLLAGFSVFKNHVSFGFADQLDAKLRDDLEKKGYTTGSKTVQIKFDQSIPAAEIRGIIKTRAKINEEK